MLRILIVIGLLLMPTMAAAQQGDHGVTITASDGLELIGDFYMPDGATDAVLLLHMLGSQRSAWEPLVPALVNAEMAVLAIDMRGHGDTGGQQEWDLAEEDVKLLVDWLRNQGDIDNVAIVGASIGSNLALRGAANDENVVTAVALSPGLDYRGVTTDDAIMATTQPALLVASRGDSYSANSVMDLFAASNGEIQVRLYAGRAHGTSIFGAEDGLVDLIVMWLTEQFA